ncbi:MAG: regulatory protein RecX [Candidatus Korobacteraceae bacterium]
MSGKRSQRYYDEQALYQYAVEALGRRMRSVAELKRLMRSRVARQADGEALIDRVVARLKQQRYLNDASYAAAYSSFRKENEKFGPRRVVQDLKARGVHAEVIGAAVRAAYEGVDESQLARQFLERKRIRQPQDRKEAARVFRAMARAGFSSAVIVGILKKWSVEDEVLSVLEQEREEAESRSKLEEDNG